ncbi:Mic26p NDAI_0D02580 [Naumovozyma dairenensis CBS 421]|uniref:MICOS complex subunit n=1 Tax=Naumovozyma dairenensis (strain ATCC 10597 / BCRC 20456 / CBS 421 / NBRC 0211 / NRRL Y-12639) TaxID=1071378 RepID=G0W9W1_NAUDC|nr:hypothetical protein NDAI_0D02580 [Naumovozyma dairenensis CBS 421]CCD24572.1 hypothetical protein NDAI_0D02580 [Naumovozyma dairenensis CBS 421]
MEINFYREPDLVKEGVIPSADTIDLTAAKNDDTTPQLKIQKKTQEILGDNNLIDGISIRNPNYLNDYIRSQRTKLAGFVEKTNGKINDATSRYIDKEQNITTTIKDLHTNPEEKLLPGLSYTAVAFMTGSILVSKRNFMLRYTVPMVLGISCFSIVMPCTFNNVKHLTYNLENKYMPNFTRRQDMINDKIRKNAAFIRSSMVKNMDIISKPFYKLQGYLPKWMNDTSK